MNDIEQISPDDKNIAVIAHLGGTIFSVFPSLIIWLMNKNRRSFLEENAKEALNFQITLFIYYFFSYLLSFILIGFAFMGLIWISNIVLCILAAVSSSKGMTYRYPFTLRLIN